MAAIMAFAQRNNGGVSGEESEGIMKWRSGR